MLLAYFLVGAVTARKAENRGLTFLLNLYYPGRVASIQAKLAESFV